MTDPFDSHTLDIVAGAAQRGWTPKDLFHLYGNDIHALLYRAALRAAARVDSPTIRNAWLMLLPPDNPYVSRAKILKWTEQIHLLPRLRDGGYITAPKDDEDPRTAKMRRKIEALLRKAESTTFEEEASALVARAQALRQAHRIHDVSPDGAAVQARRVYVTGPYVKHKFTLMTVIARANGVSGVLMHDRGIGCLFGAADDLDHVLDLYESLVRQGEYFMRHSGDAEIASFMRQTASFRRSFLLAYAARIGDLLEQANASSPEEYGSTDGSGQAGVSDALAVLEERTSAAELARAEVFPHLSSISLSASNALGQQAGVDAAEAAHLRGDSSGVAPARRSLSA